MSRQSETMWGFTVDSLRFMHGDDRERRKTEREESSAFIRTYKKNVFVKYVKQ